MKTHILRQVAFFFENRIVYETVWKNVVETDRSQILKHGACAVHAE
jgi:hypothetical protein